jgi:hypothetical protein
MTDDFKEFMMIFAIALIVVFFWAFDTWCEGQLTEQERVEYQQRRLSEAKLTEM